MAKLFNRARMTVTSTGTGTLSLGSAVTGYQSFSAAGVASGDVVSYAIEDGASWEIGTGTYTSSGTTLTRTVTASSNSNTAISVTSSAQVFVTALAADIANPATWGSGVSTFMTTPTSANLAAALTDETGTGSAVFATSPTITTPTATGLKETKTAPSISSGTLSLDCSAGNVFAVSLNANITTLSFTNVPSSGTAYGLTLALTADGTARTITWGSAVKWPGGTAPTLTSTNAKVDTFVLTTWDGGTTWYAFTGGQNA